MGRNCTIDAPFARACVGGLFGPHFPHFHRLTNLPNGPFPNSAVSTEKR